MLRLFFILILIYFLLRLVRRVVGGLAPPPGSAQPKDEFPPRPRSGPAGVIDEMKRCPACGTFNPTRLAWRKNDLYFCDERCHEAFIPRERAP